VVTMIEGGGAFEEGSEMTAGPAVRHILESYYGVIQSKKDPHPTGTLPLGMTPEEAKQLEKTRTEKAAKEIPRAAALKKHPRRGAVR
jgi:hypothetical protein